MHLMATFSEKFKCPVQILILVLSLKVVYKPHHELSFILMLTVFLLAYLFVQCQLNSYLYLTMMLTQNTC